MPATAVLIALQAVAAISPDATAALAAAGNASRVARLPTVQVSATGERRAVEDVPASVDVVPAAQARRGGAGTSLVEKLAGVPGVVARDRQNLAQDLQLSIRGFGSRASFGIRGVRVLQDGFPVTMPDGQGQASNLDLGGMDRIEVLRGPFSALYGNAAGGVLQVFSARGADDPGWRAGVAAGADGLRRVSANLRGADAGFDYNVDAMRFHTDGFRGHGAAERDLFNAKLAWTLGTRAELGLLANALSAPDAQDPLGLSDAQWRSDPRQAAPTAVQFDTRKALQHRMLGLDLRVDRGAGTQWRLLAYGGTRDVLQFLAVPVAAQANPRSGGGVVDLASRFGGAELRWSRRGLLAGRPLRASLGVATDTQVQHRRGFENFLGATLGVRGALRRDQRDVVDDVDQFAQLDWQPTARLGVLLGLRHSVLRFDSDDAYVRPGNPDDGGLRRFAATTPVAGARWKFGNGTSLFLSAGEGMETPTFDELAYRPDGNGGLNIQLRAANSRSVELGLRAPALARVQWQAALFRADTDAELVVASNSGGRSAYQNAGHARRQGVELAASGAIASHWHAQGSWTLLDARFRDAFLGCGTGTCTVPTQVVEAGTRLPGLPRVQAFASLDWHGRHGLGAVLSMQAASAVQVANTGSERAPGYTLFDVELSMRSAHRHLPAATLRLGNLFDRHYVGSVIVNEANGRYYEPAPGRSLMFLLDWRE